jgi:hypothetical protein
MVEGRALTTPALQDAPSSIWSPCRAALGEFRGALKVSSRYPTTAETVNTTAKSVMLKICLSSLRPKNRWPSTHLRASNFQINQIGVSPLTNTLASSLSKSDDGSVCTEMTLTKQPTVDDIKQILPTTSRIARAFSCFHSSQPKAYSGILGSAFTDFLLHRVYLCNSYGVRRKPWNTFLASRYAPTTCPAVLMPIPPLP